MPIATLSISHNFMNINTPSKKALEKEKMGGEEQEVKRQHGASRPVALSMQWRCLLVHLSRTLKQL